MSLPLPASVVGAVTTTRHSGIVNVAHRGASSVAPENTLAAIRSAVDSGADLVEVDVQRSRDGALVLMHDTSLVRTTNVRRVFPHRQPWKVGDFSYDELMRLDAGSWKSGEFAGETIPRFTDVIEVIRGSEAGLLVELKAVGQHPGIVSDLISEVRGLPGYRELAVDSRRLIAQSFDFAAMKDHKTQEPSIPVALLGTPAKANLPALATWADFINPRHSFAFQGYVEHVHALGMGCLVWTVDRVPAMKRALRMGVDGIITNRPDVLARVGLTRR
jgi:glycerophosphoryl diester phosphodiesterase